MVFIYTDWWDYLTGDAGCFDALFGDVDEDIDSDVNGNYGR